MLDVADTIYPRLKPRPTLLELQLLFTPTPAEIQQVQHSVRSPAGTIARLVLLKVAQHLHQLVFLKDIPSVIHKHVSRTVQISMTLPKLFGQDHPVLRQGHLTFLKSQLHWETPAQQQVEGLLKKHAQRFDDLISILNAGIEDLTRQHFELPGFTHLVRTARQVRSDVNGEIYEQVCHQLGEEGVAQLDFLFHGEQDETVSLWGTLKQDSSKASVSQMKHLLRKLDALGERTPTVDVHGLMSRSKRDQWVQEALSHNRQAMVRLKPSKRHTLALLLLQSRQARIRDDLGTMLVKTMFRLRSGALKRLKDLQIQHQTHTDQLVEQLRGVAEVLGTADQEPGEVLKKLKQAIPDPERTLQGIDEYQGRSRDNFVPFMLRRYPSHRTALMGLLRSVKFKSTSENTDLEQAVRYVLENEGERSLNLSTFTTRRDSPDEPIQVIPLVPLSWVPEVWAPFVFSQQGRRTIVWEGLKVASVSQGIM